MSDRYFNTEYKYLVEQGREYAEMYPDLARELKLGDARNRDPNVERMLEGFAFLTGRVMRRLDDDLPALVDGLLSLVRPHHGMAIPSCCLVQFLPRRGGLNHALSVPKGAEVESEPGPGGASCRYRTCHQVTVPPFTFSGVNSETTGAASRLTLSFSMPPGADLSFLEGQAVRVQIAGEQAEGRGLYDFLLGRKGRKRRLGKIRLAGLKGGNKTPLAVLGPESLAPAGLTPEESLLPKGEPAFWGFGLLEDYFLFSDKFLAFHLDGLAPLASLEHQDGFELVMEFDAPWPSSLKPGRESFRLGCAAAVNLFSMEGEPIRVDHLTSEYKVKVDLHNPRHYQVFSVDQVEGISLEGGYRRAYRPLYSANSYLSGQGQDPAGPFYVLNRAASSWGGSDLRIGLVNPRQRGESPSRETLSVLLTASNGARGSTPLAGQINRNVSKVPPALAPSNLSQPTAAVFPAADAPSPWEWLGHAAFNYLDLDSPERLKALLSHYDLGGKDSNQRRIAGIAEVSLSRVRERLMGSLVAGLNLKMLLDEEHFTDMGDIQLFTQVMAAFLRSYASINSFVSLEVATTPTGHSLVMESELGL